jgi:hypothetical protein
MTKNEMSEIRRRVNVMVATEGNQIRLHSETLRDARRMEGMTADQLLDLAWEVHHQIYG